MRDRIAAPRPAPADLVHDATGRLLGRLEISSTILRWSPAGLDYRRELGVADVVAHIEVFGAPPPCGHHTPNIRWGLGEPPTFWVFGSSAAEEGFLVVHDGWVEWRPNEPRPRRRLSVPALIELIETSHAEAPLGPHRPTSE